MINVFTRTSRMFRSGGPVICALTIVVILVNPISAYSSNNRPPYEAALKRVWTLRARGELTLATAVLDSLTEDFDGRDDVHPWLRAWVVQQRAILQDIHAMPTELQSLVIRADSLAIQFKPRFNRGPRAGLLEMTENILDLRQRAWGNEHVDTARALFWVAIVKLVNGNSQQSADLVEESLRVFSVVIKGEHPYIADSLHILARAKLGFGMDEEGLDVAFRALEMRILCSSPDHPGVSEDHKLLGRIYITHNRNDDAIWHFREALRIKSLTSGDDNPNYAVALALLAKPLEAKYKYNEAIVILEESLSILESSLGPDNARLIFPLRHLGHLRKKQFRLSEASSSYERCLAISLQQAGKSSIQVYLARAGLAWVALAQGQLEVAEEHIEALRTDFVEPGSIDDIFVLSDYHRLRGHFFELSGRFEKAVDEFEMALKYALQKKNAPETIQPIQESLIGAMAACGNHTVADSLAARLASNPNYEGLFTLVHVKSLFARSQFHDALALLEAMETRVVEDQGIRVPYFEFASLAARCYLAVGDTVKALDRSEIAVNEYQKMETQLGWGWERPMSTLGDAPFRLHVALNLLAGRHDQAWDTLIETNSRNLYRLMFQSASLNSSPELKAELKALETDAAFARSRLDDSRGTAANRFPSGLFDPVATESAYRQAVSELVSFRDSLLACGWETSLERPDAAEIANSIPEDAALIGWLSIELEPAHRANWGYALRRNAAAVFVRLDDPADPNSGATQWEEALKYRARLRTASSWPSRLDLPADFRAESAEVFSQWLEPLLPAVGDAAFLIVTPSEPLQGIPVETLFDGHGHCVNDMFAVSYAPSPAVYAMLRNTKKTADAGSNWRQALLIGDPPYGEDPAGFDEVTLRGNNQDLGAENAAVVIEDLVLREAVGGSLAALASLPRLKQALPEINEIASLIPGATLKTGSAASEQLVYDLAELGDLENFDVIHFATHALMDPHSPHRSSIVLAQTGLPDAADAYLNGDRIYDGLLSAQEISRDFTMNADLVTLSACQTGLGQAVANEGYIGLTNAFFIAGAKSVLASMWKVADRPTELIMRRFYRNMLGPDGGSKAKSLKEAKNWLRSYELEDGTRPYEHPVYWGGFILTGLTD